MWPRPVASQPARYAPNNVALDVAASPARFAAEVDAGRDMLARTAERFGYRPKRVAAHTAYGSAAFLTFVRDQGAIPHIPVLERSEQAKGKFSRAAFTYDRERDRYACPAGKGLNHGGFDPRTGAHLYIARESDCRPCPLRPQCTSGRLRRVMRMADEDVRDLARAEMQTGLYKRSMRLRRGVERLFADAKAKRGLTRLHLRGIREAEEEFQLAADCVQPPPACSTCRASAAPQPDMRGSTPDQRHGAGEPWRS